MPSHPFRDKTAKWMGHGASIWCRIKLGLTTMAIVVVGGSGRGVGKTALVCGLIAALPEFRWTAVKVTSHTHGGVKPILEEPLAGSGTATARYLAAGAHRALLATAPPDDPSPEFTFPCLLSQIQTKLEPGTNVLFESNRVLEYLTPDLCLMVRSGEKNQATPKPSFSLAVRHADALVERGDADRMLQEDETAKPIFQLANMQRISPEMQAWLLLKLAPTPFG
jgi:hypothetical protein